MIKSELAKTPVEDVSSRSGTQGTTSAADTAVAKPAGEARPVEMAVYGAVTKSELTETLDEDGSSRSGANGMTSAAATAVAESAGEARPPGFEEYAATAKFELAESAEARPPEFAKFWATTTATAATSNRDGTRQVACPKCGCLTTCAKDEDDGCDECGEYSNIPECAACVWYACTRCTEVAQAARLPREARRRRGEVATGGDFIIVTVLPIAVLWCLDVTPSGAPHIASKRENERMKERKKNEQKKRVTFAPLQVAKLRQREGTITPGRSSP